MSDEIKNLRSIIDKYRFRGTLDLDEAFRGLLIDNLEQIYKRIAALEEKRAKLEVKE